MITATHKYVVSAVCVAAISLASTIAHAAGVQVTKQGFCVTKTDNRCSEVVLADLTVDISRLPKLEDGSRVIYFFSDQKVEPNSTFVHVLESEDADAGVDYNISDDLKAQGAGLLGALKKLIKKAAPEGAVVVTPFRPRHAMESGMVFSYIRVTTPGVMHASVVDLNGKLIPSSERISINVIKNPQ